MTSDIPDYRADPVGFVEAALGVEVLPWQADILKQIMAERARHPGTCTFDGYSLGSCTCGALTPPTFADRMAARSLAAVRHESWRAKQ